MLDDGLDDAPAVANDEEAHAAEAAQRVQPARDAHSLADVAGDLWRADATRWNGGNGCLCNLHGNDSLLTLTYAGPAVVMLGSAPWQATAVSSFRRVPRDWRLR